MKGDIMQNVNDDVYKLFIDMSKTISTNTVTYNYWLECYRIFKRELLTGVLNLDIILQTATNLKNAYLVYMDDYEIEVIDKEKENLVSLISLVNDKDFLQKNNLNEKNIGIFYQTFINTKKEIEKKRISLHL